MRLHLQIFVFLSCIFLSLSAAAAKLIDLKDQSPAIWQSFTEANMALREARPSAPALKEISRFTDSNQVTHIRMQQYYQNFPVWNAQAVIHAPQTKTLNAELPNLLRATSVPKDMNGQLYQQLDADLAKAPSLVFTANQAERAKQFAVEKYKTTRTDGQRITVENISYERLVFVDKKQEAHWAFKIKFDVPARVSRELPANPVYILDAVNFKIYQHWDDVKTMDAANYVLAGCFGGDQTAGKLSYDGLFQHAASFLVERKDNICYLHNHDITVNYAETHAVVQYPCEKPDPEHNQLYWSAV